MESHELKATGCFNSTADFALPGFYPKLYTSHWYGDWTTRLLHAAHGHQQIIQCTIPHECSSSYFSDLSEGNAGRAAPLLPVLITVLHRPHCEGGAAVPAMVLRCCLPRHRARHPLQAGRSLPDLAQLRYTRDCEAKACQDCSTRKRHRQQSGAIVCYRALVLALTRAPVESHGGLSPAIGHSPWPTCARHAAAGLLQHAVEHDLCHPSAQGKGSHVA